MSDTELKDILGLQSLRQRDWHMQACNALSGEGLYEGLKWLSQRLEG
jgi:ADP-ribosylation factor-like protein 5B